MIKHCFNCDREFKAKTNAIFCLNCRKEQKEFRRSKHMKSKLYRERKALYDKKYRKDHKTHIRKIKQLWKIKNKERLQREQRIRYNKDIAYHLHTLIRLRIIHGIKRLSKKSSTFKLLGCTIRYLRTWLENNFKEGMNWQNWGRKGWHIDHIRPCASFDLSKESEQRKCFHYSNLQPLWWYENLAKKDKTNV
jgi:hypothetical protein